MIKNYTSSERRAFMSKLQREGLKEKNAILVALEEKGEIGIITKN